jgi:hypothetical protein
MELNNNNNKNDMINNALHRFRKLRYIHQISATYYSKLNKRIVIPSIIISGISSVLSFMASARSIGETTSEYISITVGILTIIITTLQTFTTSFGFSVKMDDFTNSANEYNKIIVELKMKHNQCNTENICQLINELDQKAIKITYDSKYLPPQWVYEKWTKGKNKYGGPNGGSEVGSPSRNLIKTSILENIGNRKHLTPKNKLEDLTNDINLIYSDDTLTNNTLTNNTLTNDILKINIDEDKINNDRIDNDRIDNDRIDNDRIDNDSIDSISIV